MKDNDNMIKRKAYICLVYIFLLIVSFTGCTDTNEKNVATPVPVRVKIVNQEKEAVCTNYVGTVITKKESVLSSKYPGKLVRLRVKQGDLVKAGDIIAEVESQSVVSSQQIAKATLAQAEDGYKRVAQVHESRSIADVKMVEIETQLRKAQSAAMAADKALEDCKIKAPFSGVIGDVSLTEGVEVTTLQPVVKLLDLESLEIKIPVPEQEIQDVTLGDTATLVVPALSDKKITAVVVSKGIVASVLSHCYDCYLKPISNISNLMPGMVCKVYFENNNDKIVLPSSIVRMDNEGKYVWAVENDKVCKKYIDVKGFAQQGIIVEQGLKSGDIVITDGSQKVSNGMKISIIE